MSEHCCHTPKQNSPEQDDQCHNHSKPDFLLWITLAITVALYLLGIAAASYLPTALANLSHAVHELVHTMWLGVVIGVLMLALLSKIPRAFVMSALGRKADLSGLLRATAAGVLLDLCSHGILMVAAKLYERGASLGQIMAFLIASPWNSLSLTIIMVALIGLGWTVAFILLSMVVAIGTGLLFEWMVKKQVLAANPNRTDLDEEFAFWPAAKAGLRDTDWSLSLAKDMLVQGVKDSRMVLRWLLVGLLIAASIRAFVPTDTFGTLFGPTLLGLGTTIIATTIIEVCSEGSTPIAAELLNRADAPGNAFAFLMAGVATDYTEMLVLKDTTKSWKTALFLPLLSMPQVIVIAILLNQL